ncbi:Schlafen Family Member 5 [Manis pentadactyla]|nr:Schlafen Family Member 5 [Manis pentadactyla]
MSDLRLRVRWSLEADGRCCDLVLDFGLSSFGWGFGPGFVHTGERIVREFDLNYFYFPGATGALRCCDMVYLLHVQTSKAFHLLPLQAMISLQMTV